MYVNDIADSLLSLVRLFADDSSLYFSSSSLQDIEGIINHDFCLFSAWARQWLVTCNPSKTDAMLFALRLAENFPSLIFNYTPINFEEHHKHLGLTFSNDGKWHKDVGNILKIGIQNNWLNAQFKV